jgi:hypothetical protein
MFRNIVVIVSLAVALGACTTMPASNSRPIDIAPAPVSFDGNISGRATEYTFALVPDANPATPGLAMASGEMLQLKLPAAFKRNEQVPIQSEADTNMVLTKGWPQAAVKLAGQYVIAYDETAHAMTVKAVKDIEAIGPNAPGIKVIHLRGRTFMNPNAGDYPVTVEHVAADGRVKSIWMGNIKVLATAPKTRLAPTAFQLAPGMNPDFQKTATGQLMPERLGLLLWENGDWMNHVGIAPADHARFPRYTGGLLIQDTNGDGVLEPSVDRVVGGIIGAAPQGAKGQIASSPVGADGKPILSGAALRNVAYPVVAGGGKPNPGLLLAEFRAGDKVGVYRPRFELIDGNSYQFTLEAVEKP